MENKTPERINIWYVLIVIITTFLTITIGINFGLFLSYKGKACSREDIQVVISGEVYYLTKQNGK